MTDRDTTDLRVEAILIGGFLDARGRDLPAPEEEDDEDGSEGD